LPNADALTLEIEKTKQAMLRLLSVRMRSRWELRTRLASRRFPTEAVESALDDLERVGLVDDGKFARLFLESRLRRRPRSYRILRQELRAKGVSQEHVDEAVEEAAREVPEVELARKALAPRVGRLKDMDPGQAHARAARFLAGKGFTHSLIEEVLQELL
jgi:regulatory protein